MPEMPWAKRTITYNIEHDGDKIYAVWVIDRGPGAGQEMYQRLAKDSDKPGRRWHGTKLAADRRAL